MGVIVIVLIWPVTVMTDVIGVGVHVDFVGELVAETEIEDVDNVDEDGVAEVIGAGLDVVDSVTDTDTGT